MEGEIILLALAFLASALVAVIFFCGVETAPIVARRLARSTRFDKVQRRVRMFGFW
jgi:hypothetical protein